MEEKALSKDRRIAGSELRIPATAVSRGIGIGRAVFLNGERYASERMDLSPVQIDNEISRLQSAVDQSVDELKELIENSKTNSPPSASDIFDVHLLMLESSSLIPSISSAITEQRVNVEWAVRTVSEAYAERQRSADDQHLSDKYIDVKDVAGRLLRALGTRSTDKNGEFGSVFVVTELMPSRLMELAKSNPRALISEHGGWTSHTSILARELKLPVVTGVKNINNVVFQGDQLIVDGVEGQVIVNPSSLTLDQFSAAGGIEQTREVEMLNAGDTTATLDGHEVTIRANADTPFAYEIAKRFGARGIGLYRSEIIFNGTGRFPTEAEQIEAYRQIALAVGDAAVRIRTFDLGVDQLDGDDFVAERNPSLGLRSIRLSLTNSSYFRTQIRAILQAAYHQTIDIVLPMVSGVNEIVRLRAIIEEERAKLQKENVPIGEPRLGAMIEVPSAVMTAHEIARHVDLLCLGTNDLVQYMLAVDRDNEAVADWYQTLHPAVIRAIRDVLSAGKRAGVPVTVCGEIAGSAFYIPLLLGLGTRELSMTVNSIPHIRRLISGITLTEATELIISIEFCETAEEVEAILRDHYHSSWSHLFPPGLLSTKYP